RGLMREPRVPPFVRPPRSTAPAPRRAGRVAGDSRELRTVPEAQHELEAAWQALAERERRGEEASRQRAAELQERSARVAALSEELSERSTELAAQDVDLREREQSLAALADELEWKERLRSEERRVGRE